MFFFGREAEDEKFDFNSSQIIIFLLLTLFKNYPKMSHYEIFNFGIFTNFYRIEIDLSGNTALFDRFQNLTILAFFMNFCQLKM